MNLLSQLRAKGHSVTIVDGVAVVTWRTEPRDREKAERIVSERNGELVLLLRLEEMVRDIWPEAKWR